MRIIIFLLWLLIFISCQKFDAEIEQNFREQVPFRIFLQSHVFFRSQSDLFTVLRNESEQQSLLDTIETGGWEFPTFSYSDSMLVGIIVGMGPSISTSFSIDSLVLTEDYIAVYSHIYTPDAQYADVNSPCSFVAIKSTEKQIYFNEVYLMYEDDS